MEPMTLNAAVGMLLMLVGGLAGALWFALNQRLVRVEEQVRSLSQAVHDQAVTIAQNYPTKADLSEFGDRIIAGMNQLRAAMMERGALMERHPR